jgi:hypothetical protein
MWISFRNVTKKRRFAINVFVGGVNAISGEPMIGNMNSLSHRLHPDHANQDYVVIPDQKWLDGIVTKLGSVSQFV